MFIFSKSQLSFIDLFIVCLASISFISALIFVVSFLSVRLAFVCCSFLVPGGIHDPGILSCTFQGLCLQSLSDAVLSGWHSLTLMGSVGILETSGDAAVHL